MGGVRSRRSSVDHLDRQASEAIHKAEEAEKATGRAVQAHADSMDGLADRFNVLATAGLPVVLSNEEAKYLASVFRKSAHALRISGRINESQGQRVRDALWQSMTMYNHAKASKAWAFMGKFLMIAWLLAIFF